MHDPMSMNLEDAVSCSPAPRQVFDAFFGSADLAACPVSNSSNLMLDFNIGFEEASHSEWVDDFQGIGFMRALSMSQDPHVSASTDDSDDESLAGACDTEAFYKTLKGAKGSENATAQVGRATGSQSMGDELRNSSYFLLNERFIQ
ncbi:hypothetical protein GUITHDRAFT_113331 [Guillardia theta CCMP2712]|uniref:Uncharacterized protein n=1 Tax=Guillardia theta (strain CCMP2712) TaxID=905079 RepID=L1IXG5_GUITC|nr:hypothetical protein GUITHDRAFT_113331 [Guillardia theta CCMP2712]EKX40545.1 hypothetical protein GUITHDRAFT_113331 [Guillardia theta CCMP2712]|eukprot:XP_005827525.1 hypothetical protein GUITHDRAFT_113331 [Guillardia theta CCMP2712]